MGSLTPMEQIIYNRMQQDKTEKEISKELFISKHTVKSYINMISIKLNLIK